MTVFLNAYEWISNRETVSMRCDDLMCWEAMKKTNENHKSWDEKEINLRKYNVFCWMYLEPDYLS